MAAGNGNGNGNGRGTIGPHSLLSVATAVGLLTAAVGGTWWVAVTSERVERRLDALAEKDIEQDRRIEEVRDECFARVRMEHETDHFATENRWQRLRDLNPGIVTPSMEYRPLPGDPR